MKSTPESFPGPSSGVGSLCCLLGWRIGKGEGYADLEYAMMVSMGAVSQETPVVTIVHDCQVPPVADSHAVLLRDSEGDVGREGMVGGERQGQPSLCLHSALCHEWHGSARAGPV